MKISHKDESFAVHSTMWSRGEFVDAVSEVTGAENAIRAGRTNLPGFAELTCDVFHLFWKSLPMIKEDAQIVPAYRLHKIVLDAITKTDVYKIMHTNTMHDSIASMVAADAMKDVIEALPQGLLDRIAKAQQQQAKADSYEDVLESLRDLYRDIPKTKANEEKLAGITQKGKQVSEQAAQESKKADAAAAKCDEALDILEDSTSDEGAAFSQDIAATLETVAGQIAETQEAIESVLGCSWSETGGAHSGKLPMAQREAIVKLLSQSDLLKKIAKIAGRFELLNERLKKDKHKRGSDVLVDVTMGNKINHLIGSERMRLAHPILKKEMFGRLCDSRALIWQHEDIVTMGKGPIIIVEDNSGSMNGPPIEWAKAISYTLFREASKRGRKIFYAMFSSDGWCPKDEFGKGDDLAFLSFAQQTSGQGTNYGLAFGAIQGALKQDAWKKADVIFITDASVNYAADHPYVLDLKKALEAADAKCLGISINCENSAIDQLKNFCHSAWGINFNKQSASEDVITNLFSEIA